MLYNEKIWFGAALFSPVKIALYGVLLAKGKVTCGELYKNCISLISVCKLDVFVTILCEFVLQMDLIVVTPWPFLQVLQNLYRTWAVVL